MDELDRLFECAVEIAVRAHEGQRDKGGNPYIDHPLAVAAGLAEKKLKIVGVLHDVLEDSDLTAKDLLASGIPQELVEAVCVLTHKKGDSLSYADYIYLVKKNPMARAVKISDIRHNLQLSRIPNPTARDYERCEKYKRALSYLEAADEV
ncbi:MAG: GTP pyrophosphokinase [Eubacteriales bacterium]|nr:GTP pyrophosphokinase [Eubacteriales bacterium]